MKILLLIRNFDFGGAENHVRNLANELCLSDCSVWLISRKGRQLEQLIQGVNHRTIEFSDYLILPQLLKLIQVIKREKFDVIHAHQHLPILLATLAGKITGTPVIATIHGRIKHDLPYNFEKKSIQRVIAISRNSLKGLKMHELTKDKSILIPNGIHLPEFKKTNGYPGLSIYYVSRINKRHANLIGLILKEVWPVFISRYPEARFNILGDGNFLGKIIDAVNSGHNNLQSSVKVIGYTSDISQEISNASLVIGVGRVALKSLAKGIPVFSLKVNRLGGIVTTSNYPHHSYGNFVDIDGKFPNSECILNTLEDFVINQEFYRNEALILQQKIAEEYNIKNIIASTIEVYKEVKK